MATPATFVDGTTQQSAANFNKFLASDGTKVQVKVYHARIVYDGGDLVVESANDSAGIVTGDLTYDDMADMALFVRAHAVDNTTINVRFYDAAGDPVEGGMPDANTDFHILVIGF